MRKGLSVELASLVGACRCNGWGSNPCDDVRLPDEPNMPLTYNGRPIMSLYELLANTEANVRRVVERRKYRSKK